MKFKYTSAVALLLLISSILFAQDAKPAPNLSIKKGLSDDKLLTLVQQQTFRYFWDGAEPVSGLARERYHSDNIYEQRDKDVIATGASGFGLAAIIVGIDRHFITPVSYTHLTLPTKRIV